VVGGDGARHLVADVVASRSNASRLPLPRGAAWSAGACCARRTVEARASRTRAREARWRSARSSARIRVMSEHPRCAALLHGGKQCRSVAVDGTEFCQHHGRLVEEHGADALKAGAHLPARRKRVVQAAVIATEPVPAAGNGHGSVDPASVRPRLAEAAAASVEDIRRVLLETATGANKNLWVTISCKHCDRAGRYEITVPDNKVRLDAIQALLHESLGRPGQAETQAAPALPRTAGAGPSAVVGSADARVRDPVRRRDRRRHVRRRRRTAPAAARAAEQRRAPCAVRGACRLSGLTRFPADGGG
jgi:hypothetical protein